MPFFNEEGNVRAVLEECDRVLARLAQDQVTDEGEDEGMDLELIAVDDGSTDARRQEAGTADCNAADLRLITNQENHGKGNALKQGFNASSGDVVGFLDAGLEIHPRHFVDFLELMRTKHADVVIGSKRHPQSMVEYPLRRRLLSSAYYFGVRLLLGLGVTDTQVGIKLFRRDVLEEVMPLLARDRYAFDVELLASISRRGYRIEEAPIELNFKPGWEHIDLRDILRMGLALLVIAYKMHILRYYDRKDKDQDPAT